ncbi:hypothetical protein GCM10011489_07100 [Gordonia jinhuaensis]|uniref:Uncharacterized protein n=1 Tax=Gordonia jinhuaensis TaxID=1517702 RepID=A0A916SWY1_9ACTN|nr:hypothetical protein GCM10011489_07100 [Gordonia jinhuaensis]
MRPPLVQHVAMATELWLVVILMQIVAYVGEYSRGRDIMRDAANSPEAADLVNSTAFLVTMWVVVGVIMAGISLTVVWFTRQGYNWARMVLIFFSAYVVVGAVSVWFTSDRTSWTMVPTEIGGVAALGALFLLGQRDSSGYFADMSVWRTRRRAAKSGYLNPYQQVNYPPRQYPPSSYPPGQYPPNSYPPGQYPPSNYPPGQYPQGQYRPGEPPSGQPSSGQHSSGQPPGAEQYLGQTGQYPQGQYRPPQQPDQYPQPGQYSQPGQYPASGQQPGEQSGRHQADDRAQRGPTAPDPRSTPDHDHREDNQ